MHKPTTMHMTALKRLLRYLKATIFHGIHLHKGRPPLLYTFSDVDLAGNKEDYTSTSAHLVFYGGNLISWKSSKQRAVARSSTVAEYKSLATTAAELTWIRSLLSKLCIQVQQVPTIYYDNLNATYLSLNSVMHSRMKHITIDVHFVRVLV